MKKAAEKHKIWYFEGDTVAFVKYELQMEVYKIYIDAWHVMVGLLNMGFMSMRSWMVW